MVKNKFVIALIFGGLLASCTARRYLPEGQRYFAGHVVKYNNELEQVPRRWQDKIEDDLNPEKVSKVIRSRPGVWLHGAMGDVKKEKGFKHWLKYRIGDTPVFITDVKPGRNASYIESLLRSEGFFNANVTYRIDSAKYEARVIYDVNQEIPYRFGDIEMCDAPDNLCSKMDSIIQKSEVESGKLFSRTAMNETRDVMGTYFRSNGYYYFRSDFIRFQADSSAGEHTVNLKVGLSPDIDQNLLEMYYLDGIWLDMTGGEPATDTIQGPVNVLLSGEKPFMRPEKLKPFIALNDSAPYSLADQRITLRQLNRLDVFEFVNLSFETDTILDSRDLNALIIGSPLPKQTVSTEFDINTTSNNFTGPGLQLEYNNRNLLRGAEKLRILGIGRYETQLSGGRKGLSSYEFDLSVDLLVPRRGRLGREGQLRGNVPRTKYGAQYRIFQQAEFYAQSAVGLSYGVEWLGGESHFHKLNIMSVSYLRLLSSSEQLDELLGNNVFFRESFEDQFIVGPNYTYTYNPRWKPGKRMRWYFSANMDFSGNILNGFYRLLGNNLREPGDFTLGTVPFSQYSRFVIDNRFTFKLSRTSELVFRQNIGAGFAYGNSTVIPFAKQFFVGGAISMRAFQPRAIGPGSFVNEDPVFGSFFDQTGDYLAEFNLEYRFAKGGYFEWAVFTDVGNVWLQRPSEGRPGGDFQLNRAVGELAVAAGFGLRMDFTFVLLRFDLAMPARLPYLPIGDRWILDQINPFSRSWRQDNLILNIAIGYPF